MKVAGMTRELWLELQSRLSNHELNCYRKLRPYENQCGPEFYRKDLPCVLIVQFSERRNEGHILLLRWHRSKLNQLRWEA
jgi:hypothetical protein